MKKKLMTIIFLIFAILMIPQIIKAAELESSEYIITDTYISKISPETAIEVFKNSLNASVKVYKDETKLEEVTSGNITTNMCVEHEGVTRTLSVVGDINGDGKSNQLDLTLIIRHVLGFSDSQITEDIKKISADTSGDGKINSIDVTAVIRYNVYGKFHITAAAPKINNVNAATTKNSIKITVIAENTENAIYQYSYKKEGETSYTEAAKTKDNTYTITGLNENTKYMIKVKITNEYGMADTEEKEVITVNNSDITPPVINEVRSSSTTESVTLEVSATDSESGLSGNYIFYIKKTSETDSSYQEVQRGTSTSAIKGGLEQNTSYTIKVEVEDQAGNVGIFTKDIVTLSMPSLVNPDGTTTGALELDGPIIWENGEATVKLKTNTNYIIQYQKNSKMRSWSIGDTVSGLKHGDEVITRLWDGTNVSDAAKVEIKDTDMPNSTTITLDKTETSTSGFVNATVIQSDSQSGLDLSNCKWVYNTTATQIGTDESLYIGGTFSSETQNINLVATSGGVYYLHVLTVDQAGNKIETISQAVTVTDSTTGSILQEGDFVYYTDNDGNKIKCNVLYDASSQNGLQIITVDTLEDVTLGNEGDQFKSGDTILTQSMQDYNNGIEILNDAAEKYLNLDLGSSARCVGTNPLSPDSKNSNANSMGLQRRRYELL